MTSTSRSSSKHSFGEERRRNSLVGGRGDAALNRIRDISTALPNASEVDPPTSALRAPSQQRLIESLDDVAFDAATFQKDMLAKEAGGSRADTVLYLAYGSNLCAKTFRGSRGIKPLSQLNVVVPSITLTFDLPGFPYSEPCFANIRYRNVPAPPASSNSSEKTPLLQYGRKQEQHKDRWKKGLVGVVYEVSKEDYATIIRTEGGGASYQDIVVDCFPLLPGDTVPDDPDTTSFRAHTLYSPTFPPKDGQSSVSAGGRIQRPDPNYAQASPRYMKLLTDGSEEHHLPQEYKDFLYSIQPYVITQARQRLGRFVFLAIWAPVVLSIFALRGYCSDKNGRSPRWLIELLGAVFRGLWASYDRVFKKIFGDGERTVKGDGSEPTSLIRDPSPSTREKEVGMGPTSRQS